MTNEEAIKILSYTSNLGYGIIIEEMEGYTTRDIKIALDMAIKALEEEKQKTENELKPMSVNVEFGVMEQPDDLLHYGDIRTG